MTQKVPQGITSSKKRKSRKLLTSQSYWWQTKRMGDKIPSDKTVETNAKTVLPHQRKPPQ